MLSLLSIAAGGALGAVSRHGVNVAVSYWMAQPFPYGTLSVNILGSFLMGALIALFANVYNHAMEVKLFLTVGFLGGFTTFSTFSLDAMTLLERGDILAFGAYITASVVLSILAIFVGSFLIWKVVA